MSSWTVVPAAKAALAQATALYPRRSTASDGTVGDTSHGARASDHNPNQYGEVLAFDLTHDPADGCDAHAMVRAAVARRDRRIKYAISEGRIWSKDRATEGWRTYAGSNRHDKHAHVSIDRRYRDDTSPWWTAPKTMTKEPDMTAAQAAQLAQATKDIAEVKAMLAALVRPRAADKTDRDTGAVDLGDILTKIEKETP